MFSIHILGAGGHAKVVISALLSRGAPIAAAYDDDAEKHGGSVLGIPIRGNGDEFARLGAVQAVIAVGSNRVRETIASRFCDVEWVPVVHRNSYVDGAAEVAAGSVVFAGAVVQPGAVLGAHCIINTGATVDHDCKIGSFAHLAPGVHLAGGVSVGERAFLGIGSCVIPGIRIGNDAVVGAGAVVIRDVPDGVTVAGVPARVRRPR